MLIKIQLNSPVDIFDFFNKSRQIYENSFTKFSNLKFKNNEI